MTDSVTTTTTTTTTPTPPKAPLAHWRARNRHTSIFTGGKVEIKEINALNSVNNDKGKGAKGGKVKVMYSTCDYDVAITKAETGQLLCLLQRSAHTAPRTRASDSTSSTLESVRKLAQAEQREEEQQGEEEQEQQQQLVGELEFELDGIGGSPDNVKHENSGFSEKDRITCFAVHPQGMQLVTASQSLLLKTWELFYVNVNHTTTMGQARYMLRARELKSWTSMHSAPVTACEYHVSGQYIVTGSADGTVKVWNASGGFCTHNFVDHRAVISAVKFHHDPSKMLLATADILGNVIVWDLLTRKGKPLQNHMSHVTSVVFSDTGKELLTGARDRTISIWDVSKPDLGYPLMKTIPLLENVEGLCAMPLSWFASFATSSSSSSRTTSSNNNDHRNNKNKRKSNKRRKQESENKHIAKGEGENGDEDEDEDDDDHLDKESGKSKKLKKKQGKDKSKEKKKKRRKRTRDGTDADSNEEEHDDDDDDFDGYDGDGTDEQKLYLPTSTELTRCVFVTAGGSGIVRLWRFDVDGTCKPFSESAPTNPAISSTQNIEGTYTETATAISNLVVDHQAKELYSATQECTFSILTLPHLKCRKNIIGYDDEVLDVVYLNPGDHATPPPSSLVVVATNSELVRVMDMSNFGCKLYAGHTNAVLGIDVLPLRLSKVMNRVYFFVTISKDASVRVWCCDEDTFTDTAGKVESALLVGQGHTESILCVAASKRPVTSAQGSAFFLTGSSDRTVKLWKVPQRALHDQLAAGSAGDSAIGAVNSSPGTLSALCTRVAHTKAVTAVAVSPTDEMAASASLDRTAKLWYVSEKDWLLKEAFVLRGHTRAISSIQFAPSDKVVATGSTDKTVRVWNITDGSCMRTLQGQNTAVVCARFVGNVAQSQPQLLSSGTDGIIKLWNVKTSECVQTLTRGGHSDKVWSLVVSGNGKEMITAGADSSVIRWEDCAKEVAEEAFLRNRERLAEEETLQNYVRTGNHKGAVKLALKLEKPFQLRKVLESIEQTIDDVPVPLVGDTKKEGKKESKITEFLEGLLLNAMNSDEIRKLLEIAKNWNAVNRTAHLAQQVIAALLKTPNLIDKLTRTSNDGNAAASGDNKRSQAAMLEVKTILSGLLPHSQRQMRRVDKLIQDSFLLDHLLVCAEEE